VAQASKRASETVNTRSQNLDTFEGIEERTLDLYAAVRDAYWQTRAQAIQN
jgi:phospholipid-binding lipoprotein MlaA